LAEITFIIDKLSVVNKVKNEEEELKFNKEKLVPVFKIYPQRTLDKCLLEISCPENSFNNDEKVKDKPFLNICDISIDEKYHGREIKADIFIYSGKDLYKKGFLTLIGMENGKID
jgi:hypothetical protein